MIRLTVTAEERPRRRPKMRVSPSAHVVAVHVDVSEQAVLSDLRVSPENVAKVKAEILKHQRYAEMFTNDLRVSDVMPERRYKRTQIHRYAMELDAT